MSQLRFHSNLLLNFFFHDDKRRRFPCPKQRRELTLDFTFSLFILVLTISEYLQSLLRVTCLPIVRLKICLCCFLIVFPQCLKEINTSETIPSFLFSVVRLPICLCFNHSADLFIHLSLQVSFSVHVHIQLFFKLFFISSAGWPIRLHLWNHRLSVCWAFTELADHSAAFHSSL